MARISINGDKLYSTSTGEDVAGTVNTLAELSELLDTLFTSLADGEFIRYNSSNQKWENVDDIDGGTY